MTSDHLLLLRGVADGYPLPTQHPSNELREGDRFDRALNEAAEAKTLGLIGMKLVLTPEGRKMLEADNAA